MRPSNRLERILREAKLWMTSKNIDDFARMFAMQWKNAACRLAAFFLQGIILVFIPQVGGNN